MGLTDTVLMLARATCNGKAARLVHHNTYPEAIRDNVVSNDVTIMSSLCSDVVILGNTFSVFLVK